jgi:hypothetical protein
MEWRDGLSEAGRGIDGKRFHEQAIAHALVVKDLMGIVWKQRKC